MPYAKAHRQEKEKARAAKRRAIEGLCQNCNNRTANARCDACKAALWAEGCQARRLVGFGASGR